MPDEQTPATSAAAAPNCPFYGYHLLLAQPGRNGVMLWAFVRVSSRGNQCGARQGEYSPCECESQGQPIDHRSCAWLKSVTHAAG